MLTNEKIAAIHANAVAHGFWEPGDEPTFGEYCAFIHEEISEAFSAWRNGEPDEYVKDGKPEGVWVELADVVIRCADAMAFYSSPDISDVELSTFMVQGSMGEFVNYLHRMVSYLKELNGLRKDLSNIIWVIYVRATLCGINLDAIIDRKCAYNATRPYKHGKRM